MFGKLDEIKPRMDLPFIEENPSLSEVDEQAPKGLEGRGIQDVEGLSEEPVIEEHQSTEEQHLTEEAIENVPGVEMVDDHRETETSNDTPELTS